MRVESSKNNIVVLRVDKQYLLASTFLRMQEFYESPEFKDTVIDLEEYMDWYADEYGNFTYYSDWSGFNVPGQIVRRFFELHMDTLSKKEADMYELLLPWIDDIEKFYVIGVCSDDVMRHELSHAFYHLETLYKKNMTNLLKQVPKEFKHHCHRVLQEKGYHPTVFDDECIAYFATNAMPDFVEMFGNAIPWDHMLPIQLAFEKRYNKFKEKK